MRGLCVRSTRRNMTLAESEAASDRVGGKKMSEEGEPGGEPIFFYFGAALRIFGVIDDFNAISEALCLRNVYRTRDPLRRLHGGVMPVGVCNV
jgi:hypothetical protein